MKHLTLGLLPVVIFWFFEDQFGTLWGLAAAVIWGVGECAYEYIKNKTVERFTLISTTLVVLLGGVSFLLDQSLFFKFQPVITELIFAGLLLWQNRMEESWMWQMAAKTNPKILETKDEAKIAAFKQRLRKMTRSLVFFLILHSVIVGIVAVKGTTGQWAFWKGVGLYVLFAFWFLSEFLLARFRKSSPPHS